MSIEKEFLIVSSLVHRDEFSSRVMEVAKPDYFEFESIKTLFSIYSKFNAEYNATPTKEVFSVLLEDVKGLSETGYQEAKKFVDKVFADRTIQNILTQSEKFLLDITREYFRERATVNAIMLSLSVMDGTNKKITQSMLPSLFEEASTIDFDVDTGHDYLNDASERYESYQSSETPIPMQLEMLNFITNGGLPKQSLIVPIAGTGVGKSIFLCDCAKHFLDNGLNVLYVSLELNHNKIGNRVDANFMDEYVSNIKKLNKSDYSKKIDSIKSRSKGNLIIKHYPPSTINTKIIRNFKQRVEKVKGYKFDVVLVDYIGILLPFRSYKDLNLYMNGKIVAEELRAFAIEEDCLVIAPNQTNRGANGKATSELDDMADSHGISMTADFVFSMNQTEEMKKLDHVRICQLKNRFGDVNNPPSFLATLEKGKMRFLDLEYSKNYKNEQSQKEIVVQNPKAKNASDGVQKKYNLNF